MTSIVTSTSHAVAEWSKIFSPQACETYTGSVTFMRQLTIVALSTITYLKNAFSEDNYTVDQFGGLKIRVLKQKCDDEVAQFLISSLMQAFEAFDKKYLLQLALCFYGEEGSSPSLIEYHIFEYYYQGDGGVRVRSGGAGGAGGEVSVTLDAVKERTLQMLRACLVMISQTPLPELYNVSLRLYYNDSAPEGYQAPGFQCAGAGPDPLYEGAGGRVKLGSVATPYHRLHLLTGAPDNNNESLEPMASSQSATSGYGGVAGVEGVGGVEGAVRCECGRFDLEQLAMLTCRSCGSLQHAACYGVRVGAPDGLQGPDAGAPHQCVPCAERGGTEPEPGLARTTNRTGFAIFRRALWWAWTLGAGAEAEGTEGAGSVCTRALADKVQLTDRSAHKLMKVLHENHVLAAEPSDSPTAGVQLVPSVLRTVLDKYFPLPAGPPAPPAAPARSPGGVCVRLAVEAEVHNSQQSDPLTEVLTPMERVSLQAITTSAVPISPSSPAALTTPGAPARQDSTLAEYRSALGAPAGAQSPRALLPGPRRKRKPDPAPRRAGVRTKRKKICD